MPTNERNHMRDFPADACYFYGGHRSGPCEGSVTEARGLNPEASCEADLILASPPFCEKHYLVDLRQRSL